MKAVRLHELGGPAKLTLEEKDASGLLGKDGD